MSERHGSMSKEPSHARPSQARSNPVHAPKNSSASQQWLRESRRQQRVDLLQNIAQNASHRNSHHHHHHQHEMPQSVRTISDARKPLDRAPPPRLPDVPDSRAPRNSVVVRRLAKGNVSPSVLATPLSLDFWSPMRTGDYQLPQVASDNEDESDLATANHPGRVSPSQKQFGTNGNFDVNQQIWQHINTLQQNFDRVKIANQMQEVLNYAVSMFYHGLGAEVLDELDEVQDKAQKMELRVINGQAQLWRAIILDEMGEKTLVPELLADSLLLMPAVAGYTLPITDAAPEDADFYQMWRLILMRGYGLELWRYYQTEDAKERPDEQPRDLYSAKSLDEAQDWIAKVCNMLGNCFERKNWPGPGQGRNLLRSSTLDSSSTITTSDASVVNHEIPVQQWRSPTKEELKDDNTMQARIIRDLEAHGSEYEQTIERLNADIARYKAERAVFDESLSTGNPYDTPSPYVADEEISPKSVSQGLNPEMRQGRATVTYQKLCEGNDLRRGISPTPPQEPVQQRLSGRLNLGPTRLSALMQGLAYGNNAQFRNLAPVQRLGPEFDPNIVPHCQKLGYGVSPDVAERCYEGHKVSQTENAGTIINHWANQAHGGRSLSSSSSAIGQPLSPNNIEPSEPSGKTWRERKASRNSLSSIPFGGDGTLRYGNFQRKRKNTPSQAWRANNLAADPRLSSTSGLPGTVSYSNDGKTHRSSSSDSYSPLPHKSKRVRRMSEPESNLSPWLGAKARTSTSVSNREISPRPVSYDRVRRKVRPGGDHEAFSGAKLSPLVQSDSSSGYGEKTYSPVRSTQQISSSGGYSEKDIASPSFSPQGSPRSGFCEETETPQSLSQPTEINSNTGERVQTKFPCLVTRRIPSGSRSTSSNVILSSASQPASLSRKASDIGRKSETPSITAQQLPSADDDSSSRWSKSSSLLSGTPASLKSTTLLPDDGSNHHHRRPSSHTASRRQSHPPSLTACSLSNQVRRPSTSSSAFASPLSNAEVLPLTDTPSLDEIEERRYHIREHEEQRRRSISSTSSASVSPNSYEVERRKSSSNFIQIEQPPRNTSAMSDVSRYDLQPMNTGKAESSSFNDDSDRSGGALVDTFTSALSIGGTRVIDNSVKSGSAKQTLLSTNGSSSNQQIGPINKPGFAHGRPSSEVSSTLKLQMPLLPTTPDRNSRNSVIPASPSPLRTTFKVSDDDESASMGTRHSDIGKREVASTGVQQSKPSEQYRAEDHESGPKDSREIGEGLEKLRELAIKHTKEVRNDKDLKRQGVHRKENDANSVLRSQNLRRHSYSDIQTPTPTPTAPPPLKFIKKHTIRDYNTLPANADALNEQPSIKYASIFDPSAPPFFSNGQVVKTSEVHATASPAPRRPEMSELYAGTGLPSTQTQIIQQSSSSSNYVNAQSHPDTAGPNSASSSDSAPKPKLIAKIPSPVAFVCGPSSPIISHGGGADQARGVVVQPQHQSIYEQISDAYGAPTPRSPDNRSSPPPNPITLHQRSSASLRGSWGDNEDSQFDPEQRDRKEREHKR
ncbi:hypothetical protein H2198_004394 [Neophaeococcomyces mojaviensis]|uniref:Uncharacterized protein n=1 Tax=Neophaeococcomyces mojaviensis TaxID=3383035 RepID=A0ACC3A8L0_9EURO|nr:hypothetical protein H2198_004394 [Knufia sp. JES_112]